MTHWYETDEWIRIVDMIFGDERRVEDGMFLGKTAVAADRRLLAEKIRALPEGLRKGDVVLGDVLTVLEADS